MSYEIISALSTSIDNVYNNVLQDNGRKTLASLKGECLEISFRTIINIARESDLHLQMANLKKEGNDFIKSKLKSIKTDFNKASKRKLNTKLITERDNLETLTVSPYSPCKTLKFTLVYTYEVK